MVAPLESGLVDVSRAAEAVRALAGPIPKLAVVLGSGLGHLIDHLSEPVSVPFSDLPGLPRTGVAGHDGRFVMGRLGETAVVLQLGRYHVYEGHTMDVVAAPVRILAALGVDVLIMTNATGGVSKHMGPGTLVLLDDQINLTFRNPLVGPVAGAEARFPDMSMPFDRSLQLLAMSVSDDLGLHLARGTYAGVLGPAYETAAEVRMLAGFGADVVGMSTVPEVVVARALGLRCVGLSVVTNWATGLANGPLSHEDVLVGSREAGVSLGRLVTELVKRASSQS
ncbi:MAG: purine-nucleoside phosphorylase [Gemmatimonadetes bacterium]|nr:purine-nucleoside phosphorylase [Gemmatimonadota bacterium]MDA1103739.1 purine-nucleoside phosphorylase [Gemmatimonadota bacterium]